MMRMSCCAHRSRKRNFDATLGQVVENLIRRAMLAIGKREQARRYPRHRSSTRPSARSCRRARKPLECVDRFRERIAPAPMQQIQIDAIGAKARRDCARTRRSFLSHSRCADTPCSLRRRDRGRPRWRRATTRSAPPSPYISAVSTSVMPRSRPAAARPPRAPRGRAARPCATCRARARERACRR